LSEPPALRVSCAMESIEALRGTSSWWYENEDGTCTGIEADSMHPLQAKEYMSSLSLQPTYLSHIDSLAAYLSFNVLPDSLVVRCWSEEYWGRDDAGNDCELLAVEEAEIGPEKTGFLLKLKDGSYIYEVTASWENAERYGGTAYYSFYTTKPELQLHPVAP